MPRVPVRPRSRIDATSSAPPGVRFVSIADARALVTVTLDSPAWTGGVVACSPGAIVRIRPPAGVTDEEIARVREMFEKAGSARCRVEPRAAGERVVAPEPKRAERTTIREIVMGMAASARTHDRAALVDLLDRALTAEGL